MWRKFFYAVSLFVWCIVLAAGLEVAGRVWWNHERRIGEAYAEARREQGIEWEKLVQQMTIADAPVPPPDVYPPPDAPSMGTYVSLKEASARRELACLRGELVLFCSADGRIKEACRPDKPPDMQQLSAYAVEGEPLEGIVSLADESARQDLRDAFRATVHGAQQLRDYPMKLADGSSVSVEFCFMLPQPGSESGAIIVVRPSLFKDLWLRYRSHVWRSENFGHWIVWTNNVGFRSKEVALPKPPGVFRIVCIGGSTTFEGPRCDLTYPGRLERKLREHFKTDRIEVINCGVYGIDSQHEVERFPEYLQLEPDLLVHYNFANDANGVVEAAFGRASLEAGTDMRLKLLLRQSVFVYNLLDRWLLPSRQTFDRAVRDYTMSHMQALSEAAKKAACPIVFCSFVRPDFEHIEGMERLHFKAKFNGRLGRDVYSYAQAVDAYNAALREMCGETGERYIEVAENLTGGTERFIDHCHMYLNGIDRKADLICAGLQDLVELGIRMKDEG